jgi:hypothetical protein
MSRGLGPLQRAILAALAAGPGLTSFDLAAQVYRVPVRADGRWSVSNAQRAAVRRALSSLQRRGLTFQCGRNRQGRAAWMTREQAERHAESMPAVLGTRSSVRRARLARARYSPPHSDR